jgi:hypothetical protein
VILDLRVNEFKMVGTAISKNIDISFIFFGKQHLPSGVAYEWFALISITNGCVALPVAYQIVVDIAANDYHC